MQATSASNVDHQGNYQLNSSNASRNQDDAWTSSETTIVIVLKVSDTLVCLFLRLSAMGEPLADVRLGADSVVADGAVVADGGLAAPTHVPLDANAAVADVGSTALPSEVGAVAEASDKGRTAGAPPKRKKMRKKRRTERETVTDDLEKLTDAPPSLRAPAPAPQKTIQQFFAETPKTKGARALTDLFVESNDPAPSATGRLHSKTSANCKCRKCRRLFIQEDGYLLGRPEQKQDPTTCPFICKCCSKLEARLRNATKGSTALADGWANMTGDDLAEFYIAHEQLMGSELAHAMDVAIQHKKSQFDEVAAGHEGFYYPVCYYKDHLKFPDSICEMIKKNAPSRWDDVLQIMTYKWDVVGDKHWKGDRHTTEALFKPKTPPPQLPIPTRHPQGNDSQAAGVSHIAMPASSSSAQFGLAEALATLPPSKPVVEEVVKAKKEKEHTSAKKENGKKRKRDSDDDTSSTDTSEPDKKKKKGSKKSPVLEPQRKLSKKERKALAKEKKKAKAEEKAKKQEGKDREAEKKKGETVLSKLAPLFTKLEGCLKNRCSPGVRANLPQFVLQSAEQAHLTLATLQFQHRSLVEGKGMVSGAMKPDEALEYVNNKACKIANDLETMVTIVEDELKG